VKRLVSFAIVAFVAVASGGCQKHGTGKDGVPDGLSPGGPTTRPFSAPGVTLSYPENWREVSSGDFALRLVPHDAADDSDVSVSVEIPKLPPHIPGLIPLGSVASGYVDDMKQQHAGVEIAPTAAAKVAGANARRVMSTWKAADGKALSEDAVLTVKGDRVFIFRANADEPNRERASTALDELLESVRWQ
jgi:hypothetical protein